MMETGYLTVMDSDGKDVYAEPSMDTNNNWVFFVKVPAATPIFMVFEDNGTPECNVSEYSLQLSLYKYLLEKHTSIRKIRK